MFQCQNKESRTHSKTNLVNGVVSIVPGDSRCLDKAVCSSTPNTDLQQLKQAVSTFSVTCHVSEGCMHPGSLQR